MAKISRTFRTKPITGLEQPGVHIAEPDVDLNMFPPVAGFDDQGDYESVIPLQGNVVYSRPHNPAAGKDAYWVYDYDQPAIMHSLTWTMKTTASGTPSRYIGFKVSSMYGFDIYYPYSVQSATDASAIFYVAAFPGTAFSSFKTTIAAGPTRIAVNMFLPQIPLQNGMKIQTTTAYFGLINAADVISNFMVGFVFIP